MGLRTANKEVKNLRLEFNPPYILPRMYAIAYDLPFLVLQHSIMPDIAVYP